MLAADIGITDYSSWIFDFILTKKPGFIFAPDLQDYNVERGLMYPLESTPFPIARKNNELFSNINAFDNTEYQIKVDEFLQEKGCIEDGNAARRVINLIQKEMEE